MKCDQVKLELSLLLPGEAGPPGCNDHLRLCPDCRSFAAKIHMQNQELSSLVRPTPSDWAWLVKQQPTAPKVLTSPAPLHPMARKERTFGKIAVTVALAASLLVATIGLLPFLPLPLGGNAQRGEVARNPNTPPKSEPAPARPTGAPASKEPSAPGETLLAKEERLWEAGKKEASPEKGMPKEGLSRTDMARPMGLDDPGSRKEPKKLETPPLPAPSLAPPTKDLPVLAANRFTEQEKKEKVEGGPQPSAGAANNNSLAYTWPGGQQNYFFTDPNTSRNILRNTVTPQQRVQFALNLCQYTSDEALTWVQARSDPSSGQTRSDAFKSNSTNNLRSALPPAGGTQGAQSDNQANANPAPSQTRELANPLRGMDVEQKVAQRTPEALVKEYEEFIDKDIPSLLESLRSPSNKKDLEPLVQQLSENATKWTKLAKDNPQQAVWITKMIDLSRKGIAKIEARYR